jgi:Fic family protein
MTPGAMRDLVAGYAAAIDDDTVPPVLAVGLAILDFLCIHPFPDGNGRTARLLTLMLLYHHGFDVGRYVSLERVVEASRDGYYEALERSSSGWHEDAHDARPWLDYFLGVLTAAYRELEERVEAVRRGPGGTKTEMVRTAVARRVAPFRISDIERELPSVSRELIRSVLKDLRDEGVLVLRGRGRGARYEPVVDG